MKYKTGQHIQVKANIFKGAHGKIREYKEETETYYIDFEDGFKHFNNIGWQDVEIEEFVPEYDPVESFK